MLNVGENFKIIPFLVQKLYSHTAHPFIFCYDILRDVSITIRRTDVQFQKNDVNGCRYIRAGHSDKWPKGHSCIKTLPYLFWTAICPDTKRLSKFRSIVLLVVELLKLKCPAQYHALNFKT